jgi:hypothetical protein
LGIRDEWRSMTTAIRRTIVSMTTDIESIVLLPFLYRCTPLIASTTSTIGFALANSMEGWPDLASGQHLTLSSIKN